jgi:ADP-ribose pyrophosphatase
MSLSINKPAFTEKTIKIKKIFAGKIINLRTEEVILPDGNTTTREIVEHPGAVAILPLLENRRILMVQQYRKTIEEITLEIPAGKVEPGENLYACVERELQEETGYSAKSCRQILSFYPTPGYSNEIIYLFLASKLIKKKMHPDSDEFLQPTSLTLKEAIKLIREGKIKDAKTIIAILILKSGLVT